MQKVIIARKMVLEAGPCVVVQKKTAQTDGYEAVQIGFSEVKPKKLTKPVKGHFDKAKLTPMKYLREFRLDDISALEVGAEIKADVFAEGEKVDVQGTSKGKGTQGGIKRHGHHRGPMAHGSKYHRGSGSMGAATSPGRVPKGKKLPGHMGAKTVTVQNLEIAKVDAERNLLLIKGAVPGPRGTVLFIKNTVKM